MLLCYRPWEIIRCTGLVYVAWGVEWMVILYFHYATLSFYIKYITSTSEIRGGRKQFIDKAKSKAV